MSATKTGSRRNAAVPQEPTHGPMRVPSTARINSAGNEGAAPCRTWTPSASSSRMEQSVSGDCVSINRSSASSVSFIGLPAAIISSTRICAVMSASARFWAVMSCTTEMRQTRPLISTISALNKLWNSSPERLRPMLAWLRTARSAVSRLTSSARSPAISHIPKSCDVRPMISSRV